MSTRAPTAVEPLTRSEIETAADRIAPWIRTTPVIDLEEGAFGLPCRLALKLELLQHSGSFKARGTFNRLLATDIPEAGVVAASGGNFALAVAYACGQLAIPATIFVPESTPAFKVEALEATKVDVVIEGDYYAAALEASAQRANESGAVLLHAFDQRDVVAGQGTCGRELDGQRPDFDTVVVAVGGAGLIGGIATWYGEKARVVGVESDRTASLHAALAAGEPVDVEIGGLVADSLGASCVGEHGFEAARRWVHESVLVSDDAIRDAQSRIWKQTRIACEPGSAAPLAALLSGAYEPAPSERVALLVCGGNFDPATLGHPGHARH